MKKIIFICLIAIATIGKGQDSAYYIQSKIYLTYNIPNSILGQDTTKIIGRINSVNIMASGQIWIFNYDYLKSDFSTVIHSGSFKMSGLKVDTVYNLIKAKLPANITSLVDYNNQMYYNGFMYQMATTFSISPNQISIKKH